MIYENEGKNKKLPWYFEMFSFRGTFNRKEAICYSPLVLIYFISFRLIPLPSIGKMGAEKILIITISLLWSIGFAWLFLALYFKRGRDMGLIEIGKKRNYWFYLVFLLPLFFPNLLGLGALFAAFLACPSGLLIEKEQGEKNA